MQDNVPRDILPLSDLSLTTRKIWIVTTAALPWRTGTSINPLLRALYLSRGRPARSISLVIPWLGNGDDRSRLYGEAFKGCDSACSGETIRRLQEKWIRDFASKECGMAAEEPNINILFYKAAYVQSFGSIFPIEDICALISDHDADIAVLEEPEHLNWFRIVGQSKSELENCTTSGTTNREDSSKHLHELRDNGNDHSLSRGDEQNNFAAERTDRESEESNMLKSGNAKKSNEYLGWAEKFNFVVGICHTNYSAYVKQYGIGASVIAAPVIAAFNALVVRAYCHKVIKLSGTLQSFAPGKETTSNVHGVRPVFLCSDASLKDTKRSHIESKQDSETQIYFIGKLLWAKGFDHLLEIQDQFRKRTGQYFPMNIYGAGPDGEAIKRALLGRTTRKPVSRTLNEIDAKDPDSSVGTIFNNPCSVRKLSMEILEQRQDVHFGTLGFEFMPSCPRKNETNAIEHVVEEVESIQGTRKIVCNRPINILEDVSATSISTGIATSFAAYKVGDAAIKKVLSLVFSPRETTNDQGSNSKFKFDPPKSRFELRLTPIPANFLGVMDHARLKSMPLKIFFNPSVSEVLCTTTAEALAMGKFVIIPRHPSNEFFEQFPNALLYDSIDDAVENLIFALRSVPSPLDRDLSRLLSWEAATERLIQASAITATAWDERKRSCMEESDEQIAWLHSEASRTTLFLTSFIPGRALQELR